MSGGQAMVMLLVLTTPFWIPVAGYPLQWACRIAGVSTPDYFRALQCSFAEVITAILILVAAVSSHHYLAIDVTTATELVGLIAAAVTVAVPIAVYVPMLGIPYPKALCIALMRYAFTVGLALAALLGLISLVAFGNYLTR